jgi:hypothetical protein
MAAQGANDGFAHPHHLYTFERVDLTSTAFIAASGWRELRVPVGISARTRWRIGTLPAPERARWSPPYVRGDRLYLVRTDSLDVPFVDVYRITRKGGR